MTHCSPTTTRRAGVRVLVDFCSVGDIEKREPPRIHLRIVPNLWPLHGGKVHGLGNYLPVGKTGVGYRDS